jgi:hypothetical protein
MFASVFAAGGLETRLGRTAAGKKRDMSRRAAEPTVPTMSPVASPKGESMTKHDGDEPAKRARRSAPRASARDASSTAETVGAVTVRFSMAADHLEAAAVHLVGEFNDWSATAHPMSRSGSQFVTEVALQPGRTYRYKFLIDGTRWENDWNADAYVPNEFGGDDSVLDLTGAAPTSPTPHEAPGSAPSALPSDPDAPGSGVDDPEGEVPEPNEPA